MYQATYDNGSLSLKINEVEVSLSNVIDTVKLTYDSGTSELACGSLIIPTLEFTLLNTVACVLMDTVELNVGNIPFHKFIVVSADKQEYITKFKAYVEPYERLSKGFFGDLEDGYTVHSMLNEIATKAGVTIDGVDSLPNLPLTRGDVTATGDDGTEQTQKGTNYEGKTYLEQLSLISGFLGKNIIFTRNNHIKFTNLNTTDIVLTDLEKPTRKTNSYSINKIICSTGRDTELVAGSATLSETLSLSNCYMTQEQLNALLTQFQAIEYEAFEFNHAQANLLIEPYDMVSFEYKGQNYVIPVQYLQIVFSAKGANYIVKSFVKQGESAVSEYKGTLTSRVDNVYTEVMQVRQLIANIGQFEEIEAVVAKIDNLYAKVGHIQNLLAGTITSEEINTIHLTSQNAVIDNAVVKSEMIESLAVSKLASGVIDTSKIQIQATNGHMTIADNTIRFVDSNGNTRLYMGEDTNGNFSYQVYNANGSGLLLDENGLKEIAITDGLIKTNMINNQAITGDKINWTSFCESFNSSTNTNTLDSAHITMDGKRLDSAFNQLSTTVNGQTETINTHSSQLTQQANSIQGLVSATTIVKEDGTTVGVKDEIANMKLTQDGFQVSISNMENKITSTSFSNLLWNSDFLIEDGDFYKGYERTSPDFVSKGDWICPNGGKTILVYTIGTGITWQGFKSPKVKVNKDQQLTASVYVATDNVDAVNGNLGMEIEWLGADGNRISTSGTGFKPSANHTWDRVSVTGTAPEGAVMAVIYCWNEYEATSWWGKPMLQMGSTCTAWDRGGDFDNVNERLSNAELKITDDAIIATVSSVYETKTEVANKINDVNNNINTAKNEAITSANNTLNSTIANYYTRDETNSQISVAKNEINLNVSNTYETKTEVANKINNIQVGGTNLWSETGWVDGAVMGDGTISDYWLRPHVYFPDFISIGNNRYITYQVWNPNGIINSDNNNRIAFYNSDKVFLSSYDIPRLNGESHQECTFEIPIESKYIRLGVISDISGGGYNDSLKFKFEFGNKPTDWTPNPLDVENNIDTAKQDAINSANNTLTTTIANYYTKEETNSQINIAKEAINLGVSQTYETKAEVTNKINAIEVGGTNFMRNSSFQNEYNAVTHWGGNGGDFVPIDVPNALSGKGLEIGGINYQGIYQVPISCEIGTYTISFYLRTDSANPLTMFSRWEGFCDEQLFTATNSWTRCSYVVNKTRADVNAIVFYLYHGTDYNKIQIHSVQVERGNKVTDWSPSPFDTASDIADAKNEAIDSANNTLNTTIANYYTKTETDSQINVAKNEINLGVSSTYETKANVESKVSSTLDSAKSYADTKKTEAINSAASDASTKVNNAKTELNATIDTKANASDVYTKSQTYTRDETNSQINIAKNEVTTTVSNLRTEVMSASYNNLLWNSDFLTWENDFPKGYYSTNRTYCFGGGWICPDGGKTIHINTSGSGDGWQGWQSSTVRVRQDQTLTASVYVAIENEEYRGSVNFGIEILWLREDGSRITQSGTVFTIDTLYEWKRVSVTGTAPEGTAKASIYCWNQAVGVSWWGKPMLQFGSVMTAWTRGGDFEKVEERLSYAEQKITDDAITNTVRQNFYTKEETNNQITSQGYQNSSQVQQTVDRLQIKFSENGGYNLLHNGGFENGTNYWSRNGNFTDGSDGWYPYGNGTSWVIWAQETWAGFFQFFECTVGKRYSWSIDVYVEGGAVYVGVDDKNLIRQDVSNGWVNVKGTITATATSLPFCIYSGSEGATVHIDNVIVNEGEIPLPYSPHPSEIYDGIVQIDKNGLKVTSSDFGGYTHIASSGFYLNNGSTDVFSVTSNGLKIGSNPSTSINGDVIRSGNIVSNNSDLTFNLNSGQMYYKYSNNQVGFLGVTDGNSFFLSTDAKGWCMNSDYGSFSSMGAKSVNGGNYVPYITVTSGGVSNYNAGIFMSMPMTFGSANGVNMTIKDTLEMSSKATGAGLFNPKIAWRGTDVVSGAGLFPRSSGDRIDIYTTGSDSKSDLFIRLADDVNTYLNITCNHFTYGHQSIATFRYVASVDGYGIDFYRGLNMHNYNLGNVRLVNAASVQTASLALLDDEATVQSASPTAMYALDNNMEASQATMTQYVATATQKQVTHTGTELVENLAEYIELPQDFLMCVDIQVVATPNKLCKFAITSKDEFGFVIETDTEGVTFDYVVTGTKMSGTVFAELHDVEPDIKPVIDEEEELVKCPNDNLMLPKEFIDKGYTTFADATIEEMEAIKIEQVFGSPIEEEEVEEEVVEEPVEDEVTEETQENENIIENEDDLNGIDTGTIIENY